MIPNQNTPDNNPAPQGDAPADNAVLRRLNRRVHFMTAASYGGLLATAAFSGVSVVGVLGGLFISHALGAFASEKTKAQERTSRLARYALSHTPVANDHPLHGRVAAMAQKMGVAMPHIMMQKASINNYNTSIGALPRAKDGILFVPPHFFERTSLLRPPVFTPEEQDAVIAHELAHLRNGDMARSSHLNVNFLMAGVLTGISALFVATGVLPPFMMLAALAGAGFTGVINRAHSRQVELRTDATAVKFTGNAQALATALAKLDKTSNHLRDFADNARDIGETDVDGNTFMIFRKRRKDEPAQRESLKARLLSLPPLCTHPAHKPRMASLRAVADAAGLPFPATNKIPVQTDDFLMRHTDGTILPPFTLPETVRYNEEDKRYIVSTSMRGLFNRLAAGGQDIEAIEAIAQNKDLLMPLFKMIYRDNDSAPNGP